MFRQAATKYRVMMTSLCFFLMFLSIYPWAMVRFRSTESHITNLAAPRPTDHPHHLLEKLPVPHPQTIRHSNPTRVVGATVFNKLVTMILPPQHPRQRVYVAPEARDTCPTSILFKIKRPRSIWPPSARWRKRGKSRKRRNYGWNKG